MRVTLPFILAGCSAVAGPRAADPEFVEVTGTVTDGTTTEETTLDVAYRSRIVLVHRIALIRSAGTAANWQPRLGDSDGFTADGIDEAITFSSAAVGTRINQTFDPPVPLELDSSGDAHLQWGFDAGTDNDAAYKILFAKTGD